MYTIYKFTYTDGRSYIGVTNNTKRRFNEHRLAKSKCVFDNAIRDLGFDSFLYEELYDVKTWIEAVKLECECIDRYSSMFPGGFNMNNGGAGASSEKKYGENHHGAKLTEKQAILIVYDPRPAPIVANDYNIAKQTVNSVRSGHSWVHLDRTGAPDYARVQHLSTREKSEVLMSKESHAALSRKYNITGAAIRRLRKRHGITDVIDGRTNRI